MVYICWSANAVPRWPCGGICWSANALLMALGRYTLQCRCRAYGPAAVTVGAPMPCLRPCGRVCRRADAVLTALRFVYAAVPMPCLQPCGSVCWSADAVLTALRHGRLWRVAPRCSSALRFGSRDTDWVLSTLQLWKA